MGVSKVLRETMQKGAKQKLRNIPSTSTEDGNGTIIYPKQWYSFYNGCNRSSAGKSRQLWGWIQNLLKIYLQILAEIPWNISNSMVL